MLVNKFNLPGKQYRAPSQCRVDRPISPALDLQSDPNTITIARPPKQPGQSRSAETTDLQNPNETGTNPIIEGVLDARALATEMERSQAGESGGSPATEVPSDVSEFINDTIKNMVDSPSDISPILSPAKAAPRGGKRAQNIDSSLILQGSLSRRPPEKYVANISTEEAEDEQGEKKSSKFDNMNDSYVTVTET